jgi:hypothetical protein
VAVEHGLCDVDELLPAVARVVAQHLEGLPLVDLVALHEDALGALGLRAAAERALQVVVLGEAPEGDVERALQLLRGAVDDVGEDAALGGLVDEPGSRPSSTAITGQSASRTIRSISSSACDELVPRPTSATSGCSFEVRAPTSATFVEPAITTCPSPPRAS